MSVGLGEWASKAADERTARWNTSRTETLDNAIEAIRGRLEGLARPSAMERLRQVEQRQQPGVRPQLGDAPVFAPSADPSGIFTDRMTPGRMPPQVEGPPPLQPVMTQLGVTPESAFASRAGVPGGISPGREVLDPVMEAVKFYEERIEPFSAGALQGVSRSGSLGGPAIGPAPQRRRPVGEEMLSPKTLGKAFIGDEKAQEDVKAVLEEAGALPTMITQILLAPDILLPGVGVTKVDDFFRAAKEVAKLTGPARARAITKLKGEHDTVWKALQSEAGGKPKFSEGVKLANDIPTAAVARTRLTEIDAQLVTGRVKGGKTKLQTERAKVQAELEIAELTERGGPVQAQLDEVNAELTGIQDELNIRALPFRGRRTFTGFKPSKGLEVGPQGGARKGGTVKQPDNAYPDLTTTQLDAREKVYREFSQNAKFEPVEDVVEPTVGRARFDETGQVRQESTFATEAELQGARPEQGRLGMGAGEQPVETAGPMFRQAGRGAEVGEQVTFVDSKGRTRTGTVTKVAREHVTIRDDQGTAVVPKAKVSSAAPEPVAAVDEPVLGGFDQPDIMGGAREPPPRPPRSPEGRPELPERGFAGNDEILATKEETLLRPGKVPQVKGVRELVGGLNPAVTTDRRVLVSYTGRQATESRMGTTWAAVRKTPIDELEGAWKTAKPRYTGPKDNPFKKTIKDAFDNPEFYERTPEWNRAMDAYNESSERIMAQGRGEYGIDVQPFPVKEGGGFLPTVPAKGELDDALKGVSDAYTSSGLGVRGARVRTRVYEGAYQRWQRNPKFKAETGLRELTGLHDQGFARMAGNTTFKRGSGGLTRVEAVDLVHPGLRTAKESAAQTMANLRKRIDTAIEQIKRSGTAGKRLDTAIAQAEKRARPILDRIDELGEEWGAEMSHLSGQAREINARADALRAIGVKTRGRGDVAGLRLKDLQAEVRKLEPELEQLRKGYAAANLEPDYVLSRNTFLYHEPEVAKGIDSILRTKLNIGQGFVDAIDEVRLTAFAADVSPLTIQGLLGTLSHPLTTATNARNVLKSLWNPRHLQRIAAEEPEMVSRFTTATGRRFGEAGPEFVQEFKGVERFRIPFTDKRPGHALNERMMAGVEEIRYEAFKGDVNLLQKMNPGMSANVADAESANFLSKIIPAINPAETGRSVLRARFERVPVISTSFLASPAILVKDATSALAKLGFSRTLAPAARWQALSGREQLALLRITSLAGTMSTITVGSYVAAGKSPEEAVKTALDPENARFMSIAIPGTDRYIPIGGPIRSFVRAMVPAKAGEIEGVPVYIPFAGTGRYLSYKATPALKAPSDLTRNKDFMGGKIMTGSFPENVLRGLWYGVNSVLPLTVSEPSEAIRTGEISPTDVGEIAIRGGGQFAGSDVRQTSPWVRLGEEFKKKALEGAFGPDRVQNPDFNPEADFRTAEQDPELSRIVEEINRRGLQRGSEGAVRSQELEQNRGEIEQELGLPEFARQFSEGNLGVGSNIMSLYQDLQTQMSGAFNLAFLEHSPKDRKSEDGRLLAEIGKLNPRQEPYTDFETGVVDWDSFFADVFDLEDQLSPAVRKAREDQLYSVDPGLKAIEPDIKKAIDLQRESYKMPRFDDPSKSTAELLAYEREVKDFMAFVRVEVARAKREFGEDFEMSLPTAARILGERDYNNKQLGEDAAAIFGNKVKRNADLDDFLIEHQRELAPFFPDLYRRKALQERLDDDLFEVVIGAARTSGATP